MSNPLLNLPRYSGPAWRSLSGYTHGSETGADVLGFETEELGNDWPNAVPQAIWQALESVSANNLIWVARTPEVAGRYNGELEEWPVGAEARIIHEDEDGALIYDPSERTAQITTGLRVQAGAKQVLVLVHLQDLGHSATEQDLGRAIANLANGWQGTIASIDRTLFQEPLKPSNPFALAAWQKATTRLKASGVASELAAAATQLKKLFPKSEFHVTGCYVGKNSGCVSYVAKELKTAPHESGIPFPRQGAKLTSQATICTAMRGEYWFMGSQVVGADGDVGDTNHSGYVIGSIISNHADELGIGDPDLCDLDEFTDDDLREAGFDKDEVEAVRDRMDPREYGLKHLGWIRVKENNIQVWQLTNEALHDMANGIWEVAQDEAESEEFCIEVVEARTVYDNVPYAVISAAVPEGLLPYRRGMPHQASTQTSTQKPCTVDQVEINWHISGDIAIIDMFRVPKECRRQGLGTEAYKRWETKLPPTVKRVWLFSADTGSGNAHNFWESLGFDFRHKDFEAEPNCMDNAYEDYWAMGKAVPAHKQASTTLPPAAMEIVQTARQELEAAGRLTGVDHGPESMARCKSASEDLAKRLKADGFSAKVVAGRYVLEQPSGYPTDISTGQQIRSDKEKQTPLHWWVEVDGLVVDITADQFQGEVWTTIPPIVIGSYEGLKHSMPWEDQHRYITAAKDPVVWVGVTNSSGDVDAEPAVGDDSEDIYAVRSSVGHSGMGLPDWPWRWRYLQGNKTVHWWELPKEQEEKALVLVATEEFLHNRGFQVTRHSLSYNQVHLGQSGTGLVIEAARPSQPNLLNVPTNPPKPKPFEKPKPKARPNPKQMLLTTPKPPEPEAPKTIEEDRGTWRTEERARTPGKTPLRYQQPIGSNFYKSRPPEIMLADWACCGQATLLEDGTHRLTCPFHGITERPRQVKAQTIGKVLNEAVKSGLTSEDFELKPAKMSKYRAVAMLQNGKIIEGKPGDNHSSIAERFGFPKDMIPGFVDHAGNFVYQYSEDVPILAATQGQVRTASKQWLTDKAGEPLVVYHGSRAPMVEQFDAEREGTGVSMGAKPGGIFFTSSPDNAEFYADRRELPVDINPDAVDTYGSDKDGYFYLVTDEQFNEQTENPRAIVNHGPYPTQDQAERAGRAAVLRFNQAQKRGEDLFIRGYYLQMSNPFVGDDSRSPSRWIPDAKKAGHDGVIIRDVIDGYCRSDIYIVFSPSQVKPAPAAKQLAAQAVIQSWYHTAESQEKLGAQRGKKLGDGWLYHNITSKDIPLIEKEGMQAGSFTDRPGFDFGKDAWVAVQKSDLRRPACHQYGAVTAYEPQWGPGWRDETHKDPTGVEIHSKEQWVIPANRVALVSKQGRLIRMLGRPLTTLAQSNEADALELLRLYLAEVPGLRADMDKMRSETWQEGWEDAAQCLAQARQMLGVLGQPLDEVMERGVDWIDGDQVVANLIQQLS